MMKRTNQPHRKNARRVEALNRLKAQRSLVKAKEFSSVRLKQKVLNRINEEISILEGRISASL